MIFGGISVTSHTTPSITGRVEEPETDVLHGCEGAHSKLTTKQLLIL